MHIAKRVLVVIAVLVAIPLIVLAALPFLVEANRLRPLVRGQLEQRLHRRVSLGDMQLKTFPLSVRVSPFSIDQPEGFASGQPFLEAGEVYVGVELWPLLHKQVNIDAIRLRSPRLELIRNQAGAWNYETARAGSAAGSGLGGITLDELSLEDGRVTIQDQKKATRDVYDHIDLALKGLGFGRRGSLTGAMRLETMAAVLKLRADFEDRQTFSAKGTLSLKSDRNQDALDIAYDLRRGPAPAPVTINSLQASIGALSASATGSVDLDRTPPGLQLEVRMAKAPIADLLRIAALYGGKFPPGLKAEGLLGADVHVTGGISKPIFAGTLDATRAQIAAKDLAEAVRASELHIDFTPDSLTTRPFTLETGRTRLTAQALVRDYSSTSPRVVASLKTEGARLEELLRIANAYGVRPAGLSGSGLVTLDLQVSQAGQAVNYSGSGSLRDVTLSAPQLAKPLAVSTANVKFSEDRVGLDHLQAALGSMHWEGSGSIRDFRHPDLQFDLHVDQLNSAELREWGGPSEKQSPRQRSATLDNLIAAGVVAIDKATYERISLSSVKATVSYAKSILKLDPVTALLFGGRQSGSVTVDLRGEIPAYAIKAKLSNVDANQLLSATTSVKQALSGNLSGAADLQFLGRPNEDMAKSLNGAVQLEMGQGRLAGVHILNEVANIGRFFGYSKKPESFTEIARLTGSFKIQNGLASTNDLLMDLGGATLSGAGNVGLADQSLKLRVTTVLGKDFVQRNVPGPVGGLLTTALANHKGEIIVPAMVAGTFAQPKFAPDVEQIAQLKLRGLLPTADNPGAFTSGLQGLVEAITGKQSQAKPGESKPEPTPGSILDLFKQLGKKKDDKK